MKKIIASLLVIGTVLSTMPVMAEDPTVGVKITGDVAIDAVATIKADINVDVTKGTANSTYLNIENKGNTPVTAKITNITSQTPEAPSNFISAEENALMKNAGTEETKSKIGFYITNHMYNFEGKNIQPSTEINLGNLAAFGTGSDVGMGGSIVTLANTDKVRIPQEQLVPTEGALPDATFEIIPYVGYAWESNSQTFKYAITVVFNPATETVSKPSWSNLDESLNGFEGLSARIVKSSQGNDYLVTTTLWDTTQASDISKYQWSFGYPLTVVSDDGEIFKLELESSSPEEGFVEESELGDTHKIYYRIYKITEPTFTPGNYYFGIGGTLNAIKNSDDTTAAKHEVGEVVHQGLHQGQYTD